MKFMRPRNATWVWVVNGILIGVFMVWAETTAAPGGKQRIENMLFGAGMMLAATYCVTSAYVLHRLLFEKFRSAGSQVLLGVLLQIVFSAMLIGFWTGDWSMRSFQKNNDYFLATFLGGSVVFSGISFALRAIPNEALRNRFHFAFIVLPLLFIGVFLFPLALIGTLSW